MLQIAKIIDARSVVARPGWLFSRWNRVHVSGGCVDGLGRPIPAMTYGAITAVRRHVKRGMRVFEYGCGYSTIWWASRGCDVTACEHDQLWAERVAKRAPSTDIRLRSLDDGYTTELSRAGGPFDIVLIDGRRRVDCCRENAATLAQCGMVIFDDTEREHYLPGLDLIESLGFYRTDYPGFAPGNGYRSQTTIFVNVAGG